MKTLFGFKLSEKKAMLFNELYHKELMEDYHKCMSVISQSFDTKDAKKRYISNFIEKWSDKQIRFKFKIYGFTAMIDTIYACYYSYYPITYKIEK